MGFLSISAVQSEHVLSNGLGPRGQDPGATGSHMGHLPDERNTIWAHVSLGLEGESGVPYPAENDMHLFWPFGPTQAV